MNCSDCGAPMEFERVRACYHCEYCGSYLFPTPTDLGVQVFDELAAQLPCPACDCRLCNARIQNFEIACCQNCKGMFLEQRQFSEIVTLLRSRPDRQHDQITPFDRAELKRQVACPKCNRIMETHPYFGPGNIVIDSCTQCNMVWLDHAELNRAITAPGD